jgi:hypothetical protein
MPARQALRETEPGAQATAREARRAPEAARRVVAVEPVAALRVAAARVLAVRAETLDGRVRLMAAAVQRGQRLLAEVEA